MTTVSTVTKAMMRPTEENLEAAIKALKATGKTLGSEEVGEALTAADMLVELEDKLAELRQKASNE